MKFLREFLCSAVILGLCAYAYSSDNNAKFKTRYSQASLLKAAQDALDRDPALALVEVSIAHGEATLSGSVEHYQDKLDAEFAVRSLPGIDHVQNHIQVTASPVDDATLQKEVEDRLRYGWPSEASGLANVQVSVANRVVTLSGTVDGPVSHALALAIAGSTSGVVDVHDKLRTMPDLNDTEQVRLELSKLLQTEHPGVAARLKDGIVTLMGSVANEQEKKQLITRVNGIYGVISVDDELVVASQRRSSEMRDAAFANSLASACPTAQ
jgi:osmotically-inducible protein OsmY